MSGPSRLLLLTTSLAYGGAERQVVDLAKEFRRREWSVTVVSMVTPSAYVQTLQDAGVAVVDLGMPLGRPTIRGFLRYVRYVRRWHPSVIHSHMVHANLMARAARLLHPGIPVVCTVHNVIEGGRWREIAYRLTDPLASMTTAVSEAATKRYIAVGAARARRIETVPNGIDLDAITAVLRPRDEVRSEIGGQDGFIWVNVARMEEAKGHDLLLEAFQRASKDFPAAALWLVGDGSRRATIEADVERRGLSASVFCTGLRADVPELMAAADAFVLSSRHEGMPLVLMEAGAHGLPIVSTDVGGCREVARPADGAVLVTVDAAAIAAGMCNVMAQGSSERAATGTALRTFAFATFGMRSIGDRWVALYDRVMRKGRAR